MTWADLAVAGALDSLMIAMPVTKKCLEEKYKPLLAHHAMITALPKIKAHIDTRKQTAVKKLHQTLKSVSTGPEKTEIQKISQQNVWFDGECDPSDFDPGDCMVEPINLTFLIYQQCSYRSKASFLLTKEHKQTRVYNDDPMKYMSLY